MVSRLVVTETDGWRENVIGIRGDDDDDDEAIYIYIYSFIIIYIYTYIYIYKMLSNKELCLARMG